MSARAAAGPQTPGGDPSDRRRLAARPAPGGETARPAPYPAPVAIASYPPPSKRRKQKPWPNGSARTASFP